jgi:hypothetical protein
MSGDQTDTVQRIEVEFGVNVPLNELAELNERMETVRPGSVEYSVIWDERKALYTYFLGRLEGECQAYMNIAREEARQLFGM